MLFRHEDDFVRWLKRRWPGPSPGVRLGIGDDAAVVRPARGAELVLTTDLSIEGVHFRRDLHPARAAGHRALARALSDLAAMGARPRFVLVSLAFPRATPRAWLSAFYDGIGGLARRCGAALIGGDTAVAEGAITADVMAAGEVRRGEALRRDGARPGDLVYVTGRLGLGALGLEWLRADSRRTQALARRRVAKAGEIRAALNAHLYPEPRLAAGQYIAEHRLASAAIDVSDGFARDLARLCAASGVAAVVREEKLPLPPAGKAPGRPSSQPPARSALRPRLDPLELALRGGEDYELIFTVPRAYVRRVPESLGGVAVRDVGEIRAGRGLRLIRRGGAETVLSPRGFDHFAGAKSL